MLRENVYPREASSEVARGEEGKTLAKVISSHQDGFVDLGMFLGASGVVGIRAPPWMSPDYTNMLNYMARGTKVTGGINVANLLP